MEFHIGDEVTSDDPIIRTYDNGHVVELIETDEPRHQGLPVLIVEWHKWGREHPDQLRAYVYPPDYFTCGDFFPLRKVSE